MKITDEKSTVMGMAAASVAPDMVTGKESEGFRTVGFNRVF
jgi:hypothetical protein